MMLRGHEKSLRKDADLIGFDELLFHLTVELQPVLPKKANRNFILR